MKHRFTDFADKYFKKCYTYKPLIGLMIIQTVNKNIAVHGPKLVSINFGQWQSPY